MGGWGSGKGGGKSGSKIDRGGKGGDKKWGGGFLDRAKQKRQHEQQTAKDAKNERESEYFWSKQSHLGSSPPHAKSTWKLQEEEKELFGQHDGTVGIDFNKYENIPVEMSGEGSEEIEPIENFGDLWERFQLPDFLWKNIERCRYSKPTPIQRFAMPAALAGRDAMCCAQTGSGKTCAFLVPILSCIDENQATGKVGITVGEPAAPKAIVLAPTRELCSQIHLEARKLAFSSFIRASEVYGGVDAKPQLWELALGSDIVTATPGRLTDFINRGVCTVSQVGYLVLDEADRMLDMGFEPQIREIVQKRDMPSSQDGRMTLMFSATFPQPIQKLAQQFMRSYIWVGVGKVGAAVDTVKQHFIIANKHQKERELVKALRQNPNDSTLVFVAMKRTAAALVDSLNNQGLRSVAIHGDMEQRERETSLKAFRNGQSKCIVATDVAARGLDIPAVSHVVNYDLPENVEDYIHRIGRTGRIGRRGWATSFFATQGNYSNHKILGALMGMLQDAGQPIPDCLQKEADANNIKSKGGGKGRFGGNDARGGKVWSSSVSGTSKASGGDKGGRRASRGKGEKGDGAPKGEKGSQPANAAKKGATAGKPTFAGGGKGAGAAAKGANAPKGAKGASGSAAKVGFAAAAAKVAAATVAWKQAGAKSNAAGAKGKGSVPTPAAKGSIFVSTAKGAAGAAAGKVASKGATAGKGPVAFAGVKRPLSAGNAPVAKGAWAKGAWAKGTEAKGTAAKGAWAKGGAVPMPAGKGGPLRAPMNVMASKWMRTG